MIWEGDAFRPASPYWGRQADKFYVVGEKYSMLPHFERSAASHAQYFAALNTAWQSLPEHLHEQFPNVEKLRKYALIKAGFADQRQHVCNSKAEAGRLAAFLKPIDDYAIVVENGSVVTIFTAKSQAYRAMGKVDFQRSKDEVLRIVAELIGTDAATLRDAATNDAG